MANLERAPRARAKQQSFDRVARSYKSWRWNEFWRIHEAPLVHEWIRHLKPGLGVDVGAGLGPYRGYALRHRHRYIALDLSRQMLLESLRESKGSRRFPAAQADVTKIPVQSATIDWLLITRVLSTIENPALVLEECARILKPRGQVLITDIHPEHPYEAVSIPVGKKVIRIPAYKHAVERLIRSILATNVLEVVSQREFRSIELSPNPKNQFEKLYRAPTTPVFYSLLIRRRVRRARLRS